MFNYQNLGGDYFSNEQWFKEEVARHAIQQQQANQRLAQGKRLRQAQDSFFARMRMERERKAALAAAQEAETQKRQRQVQSAINEQIMRDRARAQLLNEQRYRQQEWNNSLAEAQAAAQAAAQRPRPVFSTKPVPLPLLKHLNGWGLYGG